MTDVREVPTREQRLIEELLARVPHDPEHLLPTLQQVQVQPHSTQVTGGLSPCSPCRPV